MEVDGKLGKCLDEKDNIDNVCEPCLEDGQTVKADGFCRECVQQMCSTCFKHHLRAKPCKHHVLVDTTDGSSGLLRNVEICQDHGERVKFYCKQHAKVGCAECMLLQHNGCTLDQIKDLAKNFKEGKQLKEIKKQIEDLHTATDNNASMVDDSSKRSDRNIDDVVKDVKTFRKEIEEAIAKSETKLISELETKREYIKALYSALIKKNESAKSDVDAVKQMLNTEYFGETALFINTVNLKPQILALEANVADIRAKTKVHVVAFKRDEEIKQVINTTDCLGIIDTVSEETVDTVSVKVDPAVCKFLRETVMYKTITNSGVESLNGRILWESDIKDCLTIEHNPVGKLENGQKWEECCCEFITSLCSQLGSKTLTVSEDKWNEVTERLKDIVVMDPQEVAVFLNQIKRTVVLAGKTEVVTAVFQQVQSVL